MTRSKLLAILVGLGSLMAFAGQAQAAIIVVDFEDLGVAPGTQLNPAPGVSQDSGGFTFTPGPDNSSGLNDLHFHNENGIGNNGSTHLGTHDDVVMTRVGGGAFDLLRFQFNGFVAEPELFDLIVEFAGGGVSVLSFFPDTVPSPGVYDSFGGTPIAANVVSLTWNVGDQYGANGFFLDNIVVDSRDAPEPATLSVLGLGLLTLAGLRRRRR